ncbi:ATP phosphoribosyltransferase (homohexameric) [Hydrogenivirga caldilitoris]|uniref:ATP phosphoribosyltransferase n=1 Tax=Hydrogenivirga caldilitoris TaxID=246264 RepID=A0A497XUA1_9AQUI|nr:ATP phosphoribosyltransferase [Hydrogenivirga caldilitoris]RLJ70493.1 ATP phosphoribosyltransferase (homohexameric) [Hydrogenivirga caldilitoris]
MISIAVPKGRLFEESIDYLYSRGILPEKFEEGRRLTITAGEINLLLVKPFDVPVYVENGAADLGVCGYDVYWERKPDVYRLLDLGIGVCRISVAGKPESKEKYFNSFYLKLATKYQNIAKSFFSKRGVKVDLINLSGSVELAPIIGLADFILDLVQTGRTLKENGLVEIEEVGKSSAWLICNRASFRNKSSCIKELIDRLS